MILNIILYSFTVFIWGSTWFAITLQLNHVDSILSVAYRFFLSSMILYIVLVVNKKNVSLRKENHALLLIQGITLYSGSYYLIYLASKYVTSGLIAVLFSSVLIFNILNIGLFYRIPPQKKSIFGGFAGVLGIILVFYPEIASANMDSLLVGFVLSVGASYLASIGNIIVQHPALRNVPVTQANAYAMAYGAAFSMIIWLGNGNIILKFSLELDYLLSLIYLSLIGSVLAFGCYITLILRMGADSAAYALILSPVIAVIISSLYENFDFNIINIIGILIVIIGNVIILSPSRVHKRKRIGPRVL